MFKERDSPITVNTIQTADANEMWDPPVDLSHLDERQRQVVRKMLREESGSFSRSDNDIGCIERLQLSISLKDSEPVARTYTSVPKPLYKEMKDYLLDLIAQGWIQKSSSAYASPVVCVRKKDSSLRLCRDYRDLNRKTHPDRQPINRVQDVIDSLGGNTMFSLLDQGKAYHQGFMAEESRHLTAFVTPWGLYQWKSATFGRIVSAEGSKMDPADTSAVRALANRKPSTVEQNSSSQEEYLEKWKRGVQEAYAIARQNAHKAASRSKRNYDKKVRSSVLYPGDRVLVRNLTPRGGPGKLRNHWEDIIHVVVRQVNKEVPIYELRPEKGKGKLRVLHRNLLLPCDQLPLEVQDRSRANSNRKPATTKKSRELPAESEEDDDEEEEYYPIIPPYQCRAESPERQIKSHPTCGEPKDDYPQVNPTHARENDDGDLHVNENEDYLSVDRNVESGGYPAERPECTPEKERERLVNSLENLPETPENLPGELRPQRPQRVRRPPKMLRYDRIGSPTCYSVVASPFYRELQHPWTHQMQFCCYLSPLDLRM
ncbi:hypothetical protein MHYP_G00004790 [Metynnis hypsauchen]